MTAGVQNLEPAAYLPAEPANASAEADTPDAPSEFRDELEQHGLDPPKRKAAEKREKNPDETNPLATAPAQLAGQEKPVLPLIFAIPIRQEGTKGESRNAGAISEPAAQAADSGEASIGSSNQTVSQARWMVEDLIPAEPAATTVPSASDAPRPSSSALAFAARLSPEIRQADPAEPQNQPARQTTSAPPAPPRIPTRFAATAQILEMSESETRKDPSRAIERPARTELALPRLHAATNESAPAARPHAAISSAAPARLERVLELPAAPPSSAHDIRVRIPDNNGGSTQVRFVDTGGEVRVSVRTADSGLAQDLRSHLSDLSHRLADGGLQTEIWQPGSGAGSPQHDSARQAPDRDGRGPGGRESGAGNEGHDPQEKRPGWLEELEASLHETEA